MIRQSLERKKAAGGTTPPPDGGRGGAPPPGPTGGGRGGAPAAAPTGGGGVGAPLSVDQMIEQSHRHQEARQQHQEQAQKEAFPFQHFLQGALAGPPSTVMNFADWIRSTRARFSPAYRSQIEEASRRYAAATPEQRKNMMPGYFREVPEIQKLATPPPDFGGRLGFGVEQAGEQAAAAALVPEVKGAGLLRSAARVGMQGISSGLMTGAQTGTWKGAGEGAALGVLGGGISEYGRVKAPEAAKRAMSPFPQKVGLAMREEVAERAVRPGARVPMTKAEIDAGFPSLEPEIARNRAVIQRLTKSHPIYSQRTLAIDDVLAPVRRYIRMLRRSSPGGADALENEATHWAEELGYRPAVPSRQVPTGVLDAQGKPLMRTIPGTPAQTTTTVAQVQQLKEDFRTGISAAARGEGAVPPGAVTGKRLAESGMKRAVEGTIPEEPIREINHVIERDLRLKEAIVRAVKRNPRWLAQSLPSILGEVAGGEAISQLSDLAGGKDRRGGPAQHGLLTPGRLAGAAAILITVASKNPRMMTRLMIALRGAGAAIPPAAGAVVRSQMGTGEDSGARSPDRSEYEDQSSYEEPSSAPAAGSGAHGTQPSRARGFTPEIRGYIAKASATYHVPLELLTRVAQRESGGNPEAVSKKGAKGVMQIMPGTAAELGLSEDELTDPAKNIPAGARYLRKQYEQFHDWELALAAYNAGPGAVEKYHGVPPYRETQQYVKGIPH